MFSLDDIIEATSGTARVISEQHDTSKVDIGGGAAADIEARIASIESGPWDEGEYRKTKAQYIADLRATQGNPAKLAALDADMRQRALRRASLDTSTGKIAVMTAGKLPWHGLGVNVESAVNSAEAIRLASLDWSVLKLPLSYTFDGKTIESPDAFSIVRGDTGKHLGTVGSRYKPIQNAEGFDFLDGVLEEFGARYETAGSLYGGEKVWMLAKLPEQAFIVNGGDRVEPYVIFSNCHDGSGAAWCYPTTVRVVCANTFRTSAQEKKQGPLHPAYREREG